MASIIPAFPKSRPVTLNVLSAIDVTADYTVSATPIEGLNDPMLLLRGHEPGLGLPLHTDLLHLTGRIRK